MHNNKSYTVRFANSNIGANPDDNKQLRDILPTTAKLMGGADQTCQRFKWKGSIFKFEICGILGGFGVAALPGFETKLHT